jgi:hypothetical protein
VDCRFSYTVIFFVLISSVKSNVFHGLGNIFMEQDNLWPGMEALVENNIGYSRDFFGAFSSCGGIGGS